MMSGERAASVDVDPETEGVGIQTSYDPETISKSVELLRPTPDQVFDVLNDLEEGQSREVESVGLREAREAVEEAVADTPSVVFGKGVVSTDRGRTERARDSIGTLEDRRFEQSYRVVAGRTERHQRQKRGEKRQLPAADGYMPGNTPPKDDVWNMAAAHGVLLEEHGLLMGKDVAGVTTDTSQRLHRVASLSSEAIHEAFEQREAEKRAAAQALTAIAFDAIEQAETALQLEAKGQLEDEITDFKVAEGLIPKRTTTPALLTHASVREYLVFKGRIQDLGAKLHGGSQPHTVVNPAT